MTALAIVVTVVLAVGACAVWERAMSLVVALQERREAERLRRERRGEPPVLGGAPRHLGRRLGDGEPRKGGHGPLGRDGGA